MRHQISKFVSALGKHSEFSFDKNLTYFDFAQLFFQLSIWAIRGRFYSLFFDSSSWLVMIGRNVRIRYPKYLSVGKNFIIEDYAEIMALSHQGIHCGNNVTIGAYVTIKPSSYYGRNLGEGLTIGDNSNIGRYSYIGCSGHITIGNNVMMGPRVGLFAENHNFTDIKKPMKEQGVSRSPIIIKDDCWIASSTTITAGVTIGEGAVIAANSVVTSDVPPYSVVAGAPARVVRYRHENK